MNRRMKETTVAFKARIRNKSEWQKSNCLFCKGVATKEAFLARGGKSSVIRCCNRSACMQAAKRQAKTTLLLLLAETT